MTISSENPTLNSDVSAHYDDKYFAWQASVGEFGGWANLTKFRQFVSASDDVLDFGCGGGYLLTQLDCQRKLGVEVNPDAAEVARQNGIDVFLQVADVPDECADVIISNNALEHTLHPLQELRGLYPKLRRGGQLVFVVPCEAISYAYKPNDVNHHLYSWGPMCLGNLITEAGFHLIESKAYIHKWPPKYRTIAKYGGRLLFELACRVYGRLDRSWFQVRAIAEKR